jgi:hypothetical protein
MWICLNDAFFSIVASDRDPNRLNVRARRNGDLERHFPGHTVHRFAGTDYAFRAFIPRDEVADAIAKQLRKIDYSNFKRSVRDPDLAESYGDVWAVLGALQR